MLPVRRTTIALLFTTLACGGTSPTAPPPPAESRIIRLEADLNFGDMPVGSMLERELRIYNNGTAGLAISGMTGPAGYTASWTNGTVAPGGSQLSVIRFLPTAAVTYNGTLIVQANHTSGTNTIPVTGRGTRDLFRRTGVGDTVFDMPLDVSRIRIIGTYTGSGSNFVVRIAGRLIVNEIIGTRWPSTRHEGTYLLTTGGVVEIVLSSGVVWSFEEVR